MSFIKSKLQTAINNNMKNTFKTLLFISLLCGVSGADEMKSVMEGDPVTLQTDVTEILTDDKILWWFKGDAIAQIIKGEIKDVTDGRFRGRLKLDQQTGSLNITNIRNIHSGDYEIQIITNTGTTEKKFTLTVYESPFDIDPDRGEVKPVEVIVGESVPLNTDINPHGDELIVWRFGCILIAKDDKENNKISFSPDERFKGRIHLDQTGSLIITDSRTAHTGEYKLKISSNNRDTIYKRFSLYVKDPPPPPLSAGAIAGITVAVLIVAAAAAVGVIYYRRWISELERQKQELERLKDQWRRVSEMKGQSVPLITDDAHIKTDKVNVYHKDTLIAQIRGGKITPVTDEISERLELNHQTGSLFISNSRRTDSGIYQLKIINSTEEITYKRIIVTVVGEGILKTVMKGDRVDLSSDVTELQKDAEVELKFKNTVIADKKQKHKMISLHQDAHGGIFRGRLKVEQQTGSFFITNITKDHSGVYELNITSSRETVHKIINVTDCGKVIRKTVKEEDSVIDEAYVLMAVEALSKELENIEADDGVNESDSLMNNAAADEVNKKQVTSPV